MRILLPILLLCSFYSQAQLVPKTLYRNNGERFNYYDQDPGTVNGQPNPLVTWLHGSGEIGNASDTTTTAGLRKLLNANTGPASLLASQMLPHYLIPGTTDSARIRVWFPQLPNTYTTWPKWIDSALIEKAKTDPTIDKRHMALMGHSLGAFGTWAIYGDTIMSIQHSYFCMSSPGGWPNSLTGSGNPGFIAGRSGPHVRDYHSANDPTAAISISRGIINGLNSATTSPGIKGPLNSITFIDFSGATSSSSGHNIQMVVFALNPSATVHALSNGGTYVFTMTPWQESLMYISNTKPYGY
jgi:hypothetical protein